MLYSLVYSSSV